jgi:hypothetical protein
MMSNQVAAVGIVPGRTDGTPTEHHDFHTSVATGNGG